MHLPPPMQGEQYLDLLLTILMEAGYDVDFKLLDACPSCSDGAHAGERELSLAVWVSWHFEEDEGDGSASSEGGVSLESEEDDGAWRLSQLRAAVSEFCG